MPVHIPSVRYKVAHCMKMQSYDLDLGWKFCNESKITSPEHTMKDLGNVIRDTVALHLKHQSADVL